MRTILVILQEKGLQA